MGGVEVHGDVGLAPTVAAGGGMLLGVRADWLGVAFEGTYDAPSSTADTGSGHITVDHFALTLLPCVHRSILFGCVSGSYGVLSARGTSATQGTGSAQFGGVGGRVGIEIPLTARFGLVGQAEVQGNVTRPRFEIQGGESWPLPPASGKLGILALFRFL